MEIKRSIMIKCSPEENTNKLFDDFGVHVTNTLIHIQSIYSQFQKIDFEKGLCSDCKMEKNLLYQYQENKDKICTNCFMNKWSEYTLFKTFKKHLTTLEPKFAHSGYYYGAISTGVKIFKSYIQKKQLRERQINNAKEQCLIVQGILNNLEFEIKKTEASIRQGQNLTDRLNELKKEKESASRTFKFQLKTARRNNITFPRFRNNEIYFGKQGMFEFKFADNQYMLEIADYRTLRKRIKCSLSIGNLNKIHRKCRSVVEIKGGLFYCSKCQFVPKKECYINYQEQFIQKCIEKKQHRIVYPKIIRRKTKKGFEYYFMFPSRDDCNVAVSKDELEKYIQGSDVEFCCLSFGIKRPVTLSVIKNNKIACIRKFGNGILYHKGEMERKLRGNIFNEIGQRYAHEHPHNEKDKILHHHKRNALKKINSKIGFRHRRFANYYNQKLTYDIISFIRENCKKPIIIFRDSKSIKDISYKGELMRRLSRWDIQQQKTFLTYKSYLNEIPVYPIPYKELKSLKCSKCRAESKEKITTEILKFENRFVCANCKFDYDYHVVDGYNLFMKINEIIKKVEV